LTVLKTGLENVTGNIFAASTMVLGIFAGSAAWERINAEVMLWINRFSGVIILCFVVWIVWGIVTGQ
jgi:fucose permease